MGKETPSGHSQLAHRAVELEPRPSRPGAACRRCPAPYIPRSLVHAASVPCSSTSMTMQCRTHAPDVPLLLGSQDLCQVQLQLRQEALLAAVRGGQDLRRIVGAREQEAQRSAEGRRRYGRSKQSRGRRRRQPVQRQTAHCEGMGSSHRSPTFMPMSRYPVGRGVTKRSLSCARQGVCRESGVGKWQHVAAEQQEQRSSESSTARGAQPVTSATTDMLRTRSSPSRRL